MNRGSDNRKRKLWLRVLAIFLLVACLTVFAAGLMLKRGIKLDDFTMGTVTISDFSLQWQNKLEIAIGTITVGEQEDSGLTKKFSLVHKGIRAAHFLGHFFSRLSVKAVRIGSLNGSLHLDGGQEPSFFILSSNDLILRSRLDLKENSLVVDVKDLTSKRFNTKAKGQISLNGGKGYITGTLLANLAGVLPVTLDFTADQDQMSFSGKGAGEINNITPFVDLFGLNNNIQRWITEYLKGSRYNLKIFKGVIPWQDPGLILDTLYAEVRVDDLEYTFAPGDPGLEPIRADYGDVVFSKGVLSIIPYNSIFYGQEIREGWVEIAFTSPADIILTVYIKTPARANEDILTLLNHYNISLPFKQKAGETKVDLVLTINLNKGQVETSGIFLIDKGVIEFGRKNYGVKAARIELKNSNINIDGVVSFEELFVAGISGTFEGQSGTGDLDITLDKVSFDTGKSRVTLDESKPRPVIRYHISPDGDSLAGGASSWNLDSMKLHLGPFTTPFSPDNISVNLPPTMLTHSSGIKSEISGSFSFKEKKVNIHSDLLNYQVNDLVLQESGLPISIQYDKELTISTEKTSRWKVNNVLTTLYPSRFKYGGNILSMINGRISYGDFLDSRITGYYDNASKEGTFLLEDLHIKEKDIGDLFGSSKGIPVEISEKDEKLVIRIPELDLSISTSESKGWSATFHDLAVIHQRSPLLQQYMVDSGSLTIFSENGKKPYSFTADIPYRYPFLVKDDTPVAHLNISGEITGSGFNATVNEELQIEYSDQLTISSKDLNFNIPAITSFFKERPKSAVVGSEKKGAIKYTFDATDGSLFFRPGAEILADRIHIENVDDKTIMRLEHGSGYIAFDLREDNFTLEGKKLDHTFMSALVEKAQFDNGQMSMAAKGTFDKFSALFKIENTILKKMKAMQNVLAFVNTIPALITFSLPEYNSRGLPLDSVIVGMAVEEGMAVIESFEMDSPELDIAGSGWVDFPQKQIDMDFNLFTQARTNVKKIPLAGYILAGREKRPSVTLKVSGDLYDPRVENSLLKQAVTLPLAVLLRTLALPIHLVDNMTDSQDDGENGKNELNSEKTNEFDSFHEE